MEKKEKQSNNIRIMGMEKSIETLEQSLAGIGEVVIRLDNSVMVLQTSMAKDSFFMNELNMLKMQTNALILFNKSLGGTDDSFKAFWEKYKEDYHNMMLLEEKKAKAALSDNGLEIIKPKSDIIY